MTTGASTVLQRLLAGGGREPAEAGGALRGATCSAEEQVGVGGCAGFYISAFN